MALILRRNRYCKYFVVFVLVFYVLLSIYSAYILLYRNASGALSKNRRFLETAYQRDNLSVNVENDHILSPFHSLKNSIGKFSKVTRTPVVEIWGKAAIGLYLWEHILGGNLQTQSNGMIRSGNIISQGIEFRFQTGPGVVQGYVPTNVEHLVLVLNGRDPEKVLFAQQWLEYVQHFPHLQQVAVVLLGNEKCDNDWILPYMTYRGGNVRIVYLTYDSLLVDNEYFYQWPLGVATYRNFHHIVQEQIHAEVPRRHMCNFVGTVYPGSSRQKLAKLLTSLNFSSKCAVRPRYKWQPSETEQGLQDYINILLNSDLTLSPVGINTECYRIYEALSAGSIPVVEDKATDGSCDHQIPLKLLKTYNAPLLYVKDWENELPDVLIQYEKLSNEEKVIHRQQIIDWYHTFKRFLKEHFIKVVRTHLLGT